MKILIATGIYPPEIGGPATYTKILEEHLPSRGIEVSVLPFSVVRRLPKIVRHVVYFAKCLSFARGVEVIFAQDPVSVGVPSLVAARLLGKRFFLRLGGDYAWEQGRLRFGVTDSLEVFTCGNTRYHFAVRLFRWMQKFVALRADRIAVQSEFMRRIVTCWSVPQEKIVVIPNGFDGSTVTFNKRSEREALALHGTIGVSAGRLVPWKGFGELIEIVPEIVTRVPDFVLYIIGDGPDSEKLLGIVAERGLTKSVIFTGRLDKKNLMRYLTTADIFILNTEYEGFSNQLLEAYAAETPIVTTDIGGNQGVVENGISGLLVLPHNNEALKDAILAVLEDADLTSRLIAGGRDKLSKFSAERVIAKTEEFLRRS